jgi:hypothetical protein
VTRRVVRLFVLLGALVAAYLVLSLFDHAARADVGSIDRIGATDPVASVKATATDAGKAIREPKSVIPKSTTPRANPQRSDRPTIKRPQAHQPKVQAPKKNHALKIQAPTIQAATIRAGETVRDAATATTARTAVVRQKLSVHAPVRTLSALPDLPQVELSAVPLWTQLPGLPQSRTPVLTWAEASPTASVPHQPLMPPTSVQVCPLPQPPDLAPASGLSGVTKPPSAQAQPRTAPLPAPPRQPADRSTSTGQVRDSGGGNAPAMGTVSSSWRPGVAAAGRCLATDLPARGRTVRYAGPPS